MKKKTIIFFPLEIGLAHITRSLAIAEQLHKRGHRIIFAVASRKKYLLKNSPVEFVNISPWVTNDRLHKAQLYQDEQRLGELIKEELVIIKRFQPDCIVVDWRVSAFASSLLSGKKTFILAHGNELSDGAYLPNPGLSSLEYRLILPFLQKIIDLGLRYFSLALHRILVSYGLKITTDAWRKKLIYLIPEPKIYSPGKNNHLKKYFVGPIFWPGFNSKKPAWLDSIYPDGKTIYLSFGGTGYKHKKLIKLAEFLVEKNYRVIVSTGTICKANDLPKRKNLFVSRFLPGEEICQRVDLIVCHGGYGTLIQAVKNNKPVIAIPYNPGQLAHGLRIEELGLGRCLHDFKLRDIFEMLSTRWRGQKNIDFNLFYKTIQEIFSQMGKYKKNIAVFNKKHLNGDGAIRAAEIIEN